MIRPFQIGDLFLVQRLGRQAVRLNTVQSLIEPQSSFWTSLSSVFPWNQAKLATHILHQAGHGLLGDGFLQIRKRATRAEVDIISLAPALMSDRGHPAIWEKLLGHYNRTAARHRIERIYADVPDQPLLVATFNRAGYRAYARQTIWRLPAARIDDYADVISASIRPQTDADSWGLQRLYSRIMPQAVQLAEGAGSDGVLPLVEWPLMGIAAGYVMDAGDPAADLDIAGSVQIVEGKRGVWLQLWADTNLPNPYTIHELLRYGLSIIHRRNIQKPVYIGVHDYQMGMNAVLSDYGFAPVSDRARMVRHVAHWVREVRPATAQVLETSPQIAMAPFVEPVPPAQSRSLSATAPESPSHPALSTVPPSAKARSIANASTVLLSQAQSSQAELSTGQAEHVAEACSPAFASRRAGTLRAPVRIDLVRGRAIHPERALHPAFQYRAGMRRAILRNTLVRQMVQRVPLGHGNRQELYVEGI